MSKKPWGDAVYFSVDIEADGPLPGQNSMIALGAVAWKVTGIKKVKMVSDFEINIAPIDGAVQDPDTMEWWKGQQKAWDYVTHKPLSAPEAMQAFVAWVEEQGGTPVFVGWPATFDFMFVYWYMIRFLGRSPFGFSALDLESFAAAHFGVPYKDAGEEIRALRGVLSHTPLEDARKQGAAFLTLLIPSLHGVGRRQVSW